MKLPLDKRMILDVATGRWRLVERINPKLDASRKIAMRLSKKQKVIRRQPT